MMRMRNISNNATAGAYALPVIGTSDVVRETFSVRKSHMWYAFASESLMPGATKIGDTTRDVPTRVDEWRAEFPDARILASGSTEILPGIFVRDHSIHRGCVDRGYHQLQAGDFTDGKQHTTEAYDVNPATAPKLIPEIIRDIRQSHGTPGTRYTYYSVDSDKKQIGLAHYPRDPFDWTLRPMQLETVDNSENAAMMGIDTMLLDASVRFGKCLTTLSIAERLGLKRILVTSGKADVEEEWKKTVEIPGQFKGWGFVSPDLLRTSDAILDEMEKKCDVIVVFMTLQDSWNAEDKRRYAQILARDWGMLAVDETHYGARAEKFSQAIDSIRRSYTLHLSGSPFRILASQEFSPDQIVACKTRTDMIAAREAWDEEHADEITSGTVTPWQNPYHGIPTPVTMALLGDDETTKRIQALSEDGVTTNFRELFATNHDPKAPKFVHETEIRSLLEMIDGQDEVLGFLNFDIASRNDLFRHMVWCLPEKDSCDAMENLLGKMIEEERFQNLIDYVTINVAGNHAPREYQVPGGSKQVVRDIAQTAADGDKTISLTVYKMLTGVTVPEWDTMLMLTNTENAEFYEQATGRLMSPFVQTVVNENDPNDTYKINRKPYVVIVDFDPARVFRIAEQRSIAQRITGKDIDEAVAHEMRYAPIITANKDGFKKVTPTELRKEISRYASQGIADEVDAIPVDPTMFTDWDFMAAIRDFDAGADSGKRRQIEVDPFLEDGDELDIPDVNRMDEEDVTADISDVGDDNDGNVSSHDERDTTSVDDGDDAKAREAVKKKVRDFYFRMLAFSAAWQGKGLVKTIEDIRVRAKTTVTGREIAANLGILEDINTLCDTVDKFPNIKFRLDNAIYNISTLVNDPELTGMEKAKTLMERFGRLSSSEVATPLWVAEKMVDSIPETAFGKDTPRFLDLASKVGEMAYALVERCGRIEAETGRKLTPEIRSVTTSPIAYVLCVAVYRLLGLDYRQVAKFTSYDLLGKDIKTMAKTLRQDKDFYQIDLFDLVGGQADEKADEVEEQPVDRTDDATTGETGLLEFDAVVSNPPYQIGDGSGGSTDAAMPAYPDFIRLGQAIHPLYTVIICPAKWMVGGRGLDSFRKEFCNSGTIRAIYDYEDSRHIFPNVHLDGGVCFFLLQEGYKGETHYEYVTTDGKILIAERKLLYGVSKYVIRDNRILDIIRKVRSSRMFDTIVSSTKPFGIRKDLFNKPERYPNANIEHEPYEGSCHIYGVKGLKGGARRTDAYILRESVRQSHVIDKYKVFFTTSYSTNAVIPPETILGYPSDICTETFLVVGPFDTEAEMKNCNTYMHTQFFRFLLYAGKGTMQVTKSVFTLIPLQDFSTDSDIDWTADSKAIDEQLFAKYGIAGDARKLIDTLFAQKSKKRKK